MPSSRNRFLLYNIFIKQSHLAVTANAHLVAISPALQSFSYFSRFVLGFTLNNNQNSIAFQSTAGFLRLCLYQQLSSVPQLVETKLLQIRTACNVFIFTYSLSRGILCYLDTLYHPLGIFYKTLRYYLLHFVCYRYIPNTFFMIKFGFHSFFCTIFHLIYFVAAIQKFSCSCPFNFNFEIKISSNQLQFFSINFIGYTPLLN